jgi:hypothetical protein
MLATTSLVARSKAALSLIERETAPTDKDVRSTNSYDSTKASLTCPAIGSAKSKAVPSVPP